MAKEAYTGLVVEGGAIEYAGIRAGRLVVSGAAAIPAGKDGAVARQETAAFFREKLARARAPLTVGLTSRDVLMRVVSLPTDDKREIDGMVLLQADKVSPFPIETVVVSHEVVGRTDNAFRVLIAVAREEVVDAAGDLAALSGNRVQRVDAAALGRWQTLVRAGAVEPAGRRLALLDERGGWELLIYQHGEPLVLRAVDVDPGDAPESVAGRMAEEITYALMSVEMDHGAGAASSIVVWHQGDTEPSFCAPLSRLLGLPVASRPMGELASRSEGLAYRALEKADSSLNLVPASWVKRRERRGFRVRLFAALALAVFLWVLVTGTLFVGPYVESQRLSSLEARKVRIAPDAMDVRNLRRRVIQLERYGHSSVSAIECLREASVVLPRGVDMTSFSYRKGESLKIAGETDDVNLVYVLKDKLDASGLFTKSSLQGPLEDKQRKKNTFEVELLFPGVQE
jgi:Tfp pilus assembly protein PilN